MKKTLSIFIVLLLCLACFPLAIFALETDETVKLEYMDLSSTSIEYDFKFIFAGQFDLDDYDVKYREAELELITVIEGRSASRDAEIYLYIYNPNRDDLVISSDFNTVNMSRVIEGADLDYHKYTLELVQSYGATKSSERLTNALVTKWKVEEPFVTLTSDIHTYNIADLEILKNGEDLPEYFLGGVQYQFYTNSKGYHHTIEKDLSVIESEVFHTYYRFNTEGEGEYTDLRSVYFAVPNSYLEMFGELQTIKAQWSRYDSNLILVTENVDLDEDFAGALGKPAENMGDWFEYSVLFDKAVLNAVDDLTSDYYLYAWNPDSIKEYVYWPNGEGYLSGYKFSGDSSLIRPNIWAPTEFNGNLPISWVKVVDDASTPEKFAVSADDVLDYYIGHCTKDSTYVHFEGEYEREYDIECEESVDEYVLKANWLKSLLGCLSEEYIDTETFSNIVKVDKNDVINMTDSQLSEYYYIDDHDISEFKEKIQSEEYTDHTWYILRYDTTTYRSYEGIVIDGSDGVVDENSSYIANLDIIHGFDTVQLGIGENTENYNIFPVGSSPTSAGVGIYNPAEKPSIDTLVDGVKDWFNRILRNVHIVLLVIFVLMLVAFVIKLVSLFKRNKAKVVIKQEHKKE